LTNSGEDVPSGVDWGHGIIGSSILEMQRQLWNECVRSVV